MDTMRQRRGRYDPDLLALFGSIATARSRDDFEEIPIRMVRVGMTFVEDVCSPSGLLLVARGQEATQSLVERFRNFGPGRVREPVRVAVGRGGRAPS